MGRVGTKRSDRRWRAEDGTVWASRFEFEVFKVLKERGCIVRKCTSSDTFSYSEGKPNVHCMDCGSGNCVQDRTYTPDIFLVPSSSGSESSGYYIEVKGYFSPAKRMLFRHLRKTRNDVDVRVILEGNPWITKGKTRVTDYFRKFMKNTPVHVWDGDIPESWK